MLWLVLMLAVLMLVGCKKKAPEYVNHREPMPPKQEEAETKTEETEYIVQSIDMTGETITAYNVDSGRPVRYSYNLGTSFLDKYGQHCSAINFGPGEVVKLGERNEKSILTSVQLSDAVWKYSDVTNYSIDTANGIFTIADSNYKITENTMVYSGDALASLESIGTDDTLQVIGKDKDIISVVVTTGHGYLQLVNSSLFVDSMICIGDRIFTNITGDMTIEVPEGTYNITVANKGYGGTASFTVTRNEVTLVDLDQLKGAGPKKCKLKFESQIADVAVYVDGKQVTVGTEVEVEYGAHKLTVIAEGYEQWEKTLVVNSSSATISLDLAETENENNQTQQNATDSNQKPAEDKKEETDKSKDTKEDAKSEIDYLTTISDMIQMLLN